MDWLSSEVRRSAPTTRRSERAAASPIIRADGPPCRAPSIRLCVAALFLILSNPLCFIGEISAASTAEDRTQFGKDIVIELGQKAQDAVCYFCSIRVRGTIAGDALTVGGSIEVDGAVEGDAIAAGGKVRLGPEAKIAGDLVAVGGPFENGARASVSGDISAFQWIQLPGQRQLSLPGVLGNLGITLTVVLLSFLVLRPHRLEAMADSLRQYLLIPLLGVGVLAGAAILNNMHIRIRHFNAVRDFVIESGLAVLFAIGSTALSYAVGRRRMRARSPLVATLLGAGGINVLTLIPFLGFLVFAGLGLLALGVASNPVFRKFAEWLRGRFVRRPAGPSPTTLG